MSKTEDLRTYLTEQLSRISGQVYYGFGAASSQYPYVVYDLLELAVEDGVTLMEIEINVLDHGRDTSLAEELADKIQSAFNHAAVMRDTLFLSIYKDRRQPVYETDKNIIRRRLTFTARLYERSSS